MFRFTKLCTRFPSSSHLSSIRHSSSHYDVIIVGGGMIGNSAAVALALEENLEDKKILVLDQTSKKPTFTDEHFNIRVINLTVGNQKFFDRCGVWDAITKMRYHEYTDIALWESSSTSAISFSEDPMGYIVENNVIDVALNDMLEKLDNVTVRNDSNVNKIVLPMEDPKDRVRIELETGEMFESELLVGADGANSFVRKTLDCPVTSWNYNQEGIVCTLKSDDLSKDFTAYQRFLPTGPIALLPLGDGHFSLVWSCKKFLSEELASLSDEEFVDHVNNAFQRDPTVSNLVSIIENVSSCTGLLESPPETPFIAAVEGPRAKFPLAFMHSSRYVGPRTVLLGDAAHRALPLAGQVANIGFRGVQLLVNEMKETYEGDVGDYKILANYETKAQRQAAPMLAFIEGIDKLYCTNVAPVAAVRNIGITFVNNCGLLKHKFMENARQ